MQRGDVLKTFPLAIAGLTEFAGFGREICGSTTQTQDHPLVAQVKSHKGTPTLFLNGEPAFAGMCWVSTPLTEGWRDAEHAREVAKAGIHIYCYRRGKRFRVGRAPGGEIRPFRFLHRGGSLRKDHRR